MEPHAQDGVRADGELTVEHRGPAVIVTLNRPESLNALTPRMVDGLLALVRELDADPEVSGVIITGAGRAFCAGADIRWESDASAEEFSAFIDTLQELTRSLRRIGALTFAALNGLALGGGFELALACDARIAAIDAVVGLPEMSLGLTVTGGVTHTLPGIIGTSRTLDLLISGRSVHTTEALELGLIDAVAVDPAAEAVGRSALAAIATRELVEAIKRQVYAGAAGTLEQALTLEKRTIMRAFGQPLAGRRLRDFVASSSRVGLPGTADR